MVNSITCIHMKLLAKIFEVGTILMYIHIIYMYIHICTNIYTYIYKHTFIFCLFQSLCIRTSFVLTKSNTIKWVTNYIEKLKINLLMGQLTGIMVRVV